MARLFRRILVPHDQCATATRALPVAAGLAADRRHGLELLHVVTPVRSVTDRRGLSHR